MDVTFIRPTAPRDGGAMSPTVFDSDAARADPAVLRRLTEGVADADLAAPPVVLPDFHHKHDLEMPSSIAVATTGTIRPALTSASVNCGMALMALDMDRPDDAAIERFYESVRVRYPHPPSLRPDLSFDDVLRAAETGSEFGVDRYGLEAGGLERVEENGRLDLEPYGGLQRLRRELPRLSFHTSRFRFGSVGPSNHFIDLQVVEDVLDPETAAVLGISAGQLTLQYHAGGGLLTGQVGRLFARRKKMNRQLAVQMALARPLAHIATARSRAQLAQRLELYFRDGCPTIPLDGPEGSRVMLANAAAMNYGFAFRAAIYGNLATLARDVFSARDVRLVVDSPHNSIYPEQVDGESALVHRHNSCRAFTADRMPAGTAFGQVGQAVLVPGTHRTSSYLCVAGPGAHRSLYSACHGAGTIVDAFAKAGLSGPAEPDRQTLLFGYDGAAPRPVRHLDDRGVDEALRILTDNELVRPVARMRPLAVLQ